MKDTHSLRELCEEFGVTPGQLNANLWCYTNNPPPLKPKRRGRPSKKTSTDTNNNS